jgi:hypothetical protein
LISAAVPTGSLISTTERRAREMTNTALFISMDRCSF